MALSTDSRVRDRSRRIGAIHHGLFVKVEKLTPGLPLSTHFPTSNILQKSLQHMPHYMGLLIGM